MFFDKDKYIQYANKLLNSNLISRVDFLEIRFQEDQSEYIIFKNLNPEYIDNSIEKGFSIRVLYRGNWGFASSSVISENEVQKVFLKAMSIVENLEEGKVSLTEEEVYTDEYIQDVAINPFDVPLNEKINFIKDIQNEILKSKNIDFSDFMFLAHREKKLYMNSSGSRIYQERTRIDPSFSMYKLKPELTVLKSNTHPTAKGFEYIKNMNFRNEILKYNEQINEKSKAKSVIPQKYNLLIDPSNLWLTIHETIGHSTEMDRVLLYEANYAGSSFASIDQIGDLIYGSEKVNIVADRSQKDGLSTVMYDDEGVKTYEFDIIKNGVLTGLQSNREIAILAGEKKSKACSYADSYSSFPLQRMPNISLLPNKDKDLKLKDMLSLCEDGIYIVGDSSWSIDMQRYNFQFTGNLFYEVSGGEIKGMLKDVIYQSNTQDFWKNCIEVGGESTYSLEGAFNCGKGQPSQVAAVSHGAPLALFKDINIKNTQNEN